MRAEASCVAVYVLCARQNTFSSMCQKENEKVTGKPFVLMTIMLEVTFLIQIIQINS